VDLAFALKLEHPLTLAEIKQTGKFDDLALVRQGRLSTMELPEKFVEWVHERAHQLKAKI
jgi:predicted RNA-binding protein with PUA-like domain